jgi:hypothetical protein
MPEKKFGVRDIVPNSIRDNVPNTKNSYFQMSSTMSLIPKKINVPNTVGIRDIVPSYTEFCGHGPLQQNFISIKAVNAGAKDSARVSVCAELSRHAYASTRTWTRVRSPAL